VSAPRSHAWFTLAVLFGINTMNFFDRNAPAAVQEKIRDEWQLTDTQLGWLGTAFILLYAVVGLPLGHLADVWRRKWLLAGGVALWSVLTAGGGLAWSFASLFAFRLGVGVGEAVCAPVASSLIGDLFPAERRARAMAVFMLGLPLGLGLSYSVCGRVAAHWDWRTAFFVAGLPGLLLAGAALCITDPPRGAADARPGEKRPGFAAGAGQVLRLPTFWLIIVSGALHKFNMYALGSFVASFLRRYHRVSLETAGDISGLVYGFGAFGIFVAGWLGDRAFRRHVSGRLLVAGSALALAVPCLLLALAVPPRQVFHLTLFLLPACLLLYAYYAPVYATIQDIVEPRLRGTAMAIYFFAMYLLGAFLGPVGTGWLSDRSAAAAAAGQGVRPEYVAALAASPHAGFPANLPWADLSLSSQKAAEFRAAGLHQAMYVIPVICAVLAVVLFAAALTVGRDRQRLLQRTRPPAPADEPLS
jgi:MFS family permease